MIEMNVTQVRVSGGLSNKCPQNLHGVCSNGPDHCGKFNDIEPAFSAFVFCHK